MVTKTAKISDLIQGNGIQTGDLIEIERAGTSYQANLDNLISNATNDKGQFADETQLTTAYPTPTQGWFAYVIATTSQWRVDGSNQWYDSEQDIKDSFLSKNANLSDLSNITTAKTNLALENVDNTSDINKPISTATQDALDLKVDKEIGKGLSTNDFDNTYKATLDNLTENVQDIMSTTLVDTNTIDFVYDDENNNITANIKDNSIFNTQIANNANIETSKIKQTTITPVLNTFTNGDTQDILNNKTQGQINNLTTNLALKQDKTDNTLTTTSKTVVGAINELKTGKNIKTWYISGGVNGSGSDNNNGYNQSNAFATLSKLNTVLGNTGEQVVLLPSQLTESATFTQQNIEITGSEASHRGICGTSGTITSNHSASSQTYSYFSCGSFIKQNAYVRLYDLNITNSFSDSGSGVIDAYNLLFNIATPISITGSGIKNFYNQRGGVFTINNIGAQVNVVSNDYISQFTLTAGLLSLKNCIVYVAQGTTFTIGSTGTTFLAEGVKFLYPNNTVAKINIPTGVSYSIQNGCVYDVANSTLNGTDIAAIYQGYFANIAIKSANLTQSTALNILATDVNKNIQSLPTAIYPSLTELSYVKGTTSAIQTQLNGKENAFAKNTAFNKNFGNTAGTVAQGNDARLGTKAIDETNISNNKIQVYNAISGKLEYQDKPTANLDINTLTTKTTPVANDFVVLGDSEAGNATKRVTLSSIQSSTSNEIIVELGGEVRESFVSYVDIPLDLTTYPTNQISISSLTNNTNNIRLRAILLDENKMEMLHYFKWTGNSRNENNVSTNEYNGAVAYFPIASERITNGVNVNNNSVHNITIQKQDSLNTYIRSEYNYLGADGLVAGGYSDINAVYNQLIQYAELTGLYTQSTIYASDVNVGTNQNLLKDNSFATGAATTGSGVNWITIDLNQVKGINKIYLASPDSLMPGGWSGGGYTNGCILEYSTDNINYTPIATLNNFGTGTTQDFLVNITARYIRVKRDSGYVALSEFRVYRQLSTTVPVISYLRVYATSGMIKLNSYVYGIKKTTTLEARSSTTKVPKAITAVKTTKAVKAIKTPQYA